jgi:nucleoside-diphosphate-sugar epimerase
MAREGYENAKVLVTGGAGCIGSNLTRALLAAGAEQVAVLDDLSAAYQWNIPVDRRVHFLRGSVLDDEVLRHAFSSRPDYVFHLAAQFANQNSIDHPDTDLQVNGLGTLKTLQYANLTGVKRFVFASSGCSVYGSNPPLPVTEDFVSLHLDTPYQITKLLGELYCNFFHDAYGMPTVNARFFNVYGPGEVPGQYRNVIPNFVYWAMNGKPLPITGTGDETRDFTFVSDIVGGLLAAGLREKAIGEAFNLASGTETKISDIAEKVNSLTGNAAGVKSVPRRSWDKSMRRRASIERARSLLGYEPRTSLDRGLRETVAWIKENWEKIQESAKF